MVLGLLLWTRDDLGYQLDQLILLRFIVNILLVVGGLPHVLPLAVHLIFCSVQVKLIIPSHFYSWIFFLLKASLMLKSCGWAGWWGGAVVAH